MARSAPLHSTEDEQSAALYALGSLDGAERAAFERHLAHCIRCQRAVDEDRRTIAQLDAALPELEPSPALKSRVLAHAALELAGAERPARWLPRLPRPMRLGRLVRWAAPLAAAAMLLLTIGFAVGLRTALDQTLVTVPLQGAAGTDSQVVVHRSGATEVALRGLPPPPSGHLYQAWIVRPDGVRLSAATYDEGDGMFALRRSALGQTVEITVE